MFTQYSVYQLLPWIDKKKLCLSGLSKNPGAIHLLEQNPDKINWGWASSNTNAIHLLEQNTDKIAWFVLTGNPSIFSYNYSELKRRMKETIAEDLMKERFHPKHMDKWVGWGQEDEEEFY